ncbi:S41 family peptidase [Joostella sp.]|uniref:S41 family peptidase n=1 Tax=Joostella sp. TaxID=2231138 RepID=UPI003A931EE0
MKKTIFTVLVVILIHKVSLGKTHLSETKKLSSLCRIWGFLKYYHPDVAAGNYKWDEQLFNVLPKVKSACTKEELSQVYLNWINSLGKIKDRSNVQVNPTIKYFEKNFNLNWMDDSETYTSNLAKKLKYIERNRHLGKKYYVDSYDGIGNIQVTNEIDYNDFDWKDENLRLLSLFRYWNIVEYFFPYKYQTDLSWDKVLDKMLPKFINPDTEIEFHMAMLELIASINDSHGLFKTHQTRSFFGYYYLPAKFKLIEGKAIVTGFYNDSIARLDALKKGDVITKVNGQSVQSVFDEREKYISGSNLSKKKFNAYDAIFNGSTDNVVLTYHRDGQAYTKLFKRYRFPEFNYKWQPPKEKYTILDGNIGLVDVGMLDKSEVIPVMKDLKKTRAIILDLRKYPNDVVFLFADYISSQKKSFYKKIYPDLNYPGKFVWKTGKECGNEGSLKYKGKVVLLVNGQTRSAGEFVTMGLQTGDNVTTIGSQTSGADGNISRFNMVGGYETMISGIGIFYPDNTETQRKGVKIDIQVNSTIQGIINGEDEILDKAIEFINK